MSDKFINSSSGMLSTKELPASGILKTNSNSIKSIHDKDSFHAKLVNSMKNTQTRDGEAFTDNPSESNSMKSTLASDEQTTSAIPLEPTNKTETDDINHIVKLLMLGLQTNKTSNNDSNQTQLNPEVNQNIHETEFTNAITNNSSNHKTSTALIETNRLLENTLLNNQEIKPQSGTNRLLENALLNNQELKPQSGTNRLLENALLNNQELKPQIGANTNTAQNQTGDLIPEPAASPSGKLNTTQVAANITQQLPGDIEHEQLQTSLPDKLNTAQNNTKMGEQRTLDIMNNPGLSEAATESREEESMPQLSKLATRQATASSENNLDKNQNRANIAENQNPVPAIKKAGSNPISDAQKIVNLNTSPQTDESADTKINEMLKGQQQNKPLSNPHAQKSLAQAQIEGEEAPKIFEANINTNESKAAKLFDNTTLANNNDANTVEAAMQPNTSSDNSAFNNQGTDTDYDFNLNTINNGQKTKTETNFNNTLSQINNSAKPLVTLGNDVADNIIQSAKLYTQGGKSEIKMQLSPPELGTIKLEFTVENDVLETKITVERSSVKDIIEKDIPRLRELISNADIDVGKLDVSLQDKENNKMDFMNKDFHSNSKSKNTQDFSQQESEYHEDNLDEETILNNTESTQINYLV